MGLRSDYLQVLSENHVKNFKSVLPCDFFKQTVVDCDEKYICNLSNSKSKGSHFVAIQIKKDEIIFFDSYGLPCTNKDILQKLSDIGFNEITYCTKCVQSLFSEFCGFFCLAFLMFTENKSVECFLDLFHENDLEKNDTICINIIKEHLLKT